MPRHEAIIMEGNGRWARQRQLPRIAGLSRERRFGRTSEQLDAARTASPGEAMPAARQA